MAIIIEAIPGTKSAIAEDFSMGLRQAPRILLAGLTQICVII